MFIAGGERRWEEPGHWWDPKTKDHPLHIIDKGVIQNTQGMSLSLTMTMSILSWLMPNYTKLNGILNNNIINKYY